MSAMLLLGRYSIGSLPSASTLKVRASTIVIPIFLVWVPRTVDRGRCASWARSLIGRSGVSARVEVSQVRSATTPQWAVHGGFWPVSKRHMTVDVAVANVKETLAPSVLWRCGGLKLAPGR